MFARHIVLAITISLFCLSSVAQAQTVTPTRLELNLQESRQAILTLSSTKAVDVALELSVAYYSAARMDEVPLDILPPQILLRSGETRQVTVSWRGAKQLGHSESFYLAIDELPLTTGAPESTAEIQLLTSWRLPVHVEAGGKAQVGLFPPQIDGSASLELRNSGRQYALLSQYEIGVERDSDAIVFDGLDIARLLNRDALLPGQTVSIPLRLLGVKAAGLQGAQLLRKQ